MEQDGIKSNISVSLTGWTRKRLTPLAILVALLLVTPTTSHADGIDVVWLFSRVGGWRVHPIRSAAIVIGLMLINYLLNLVVLGIPAARFLQVKSGSLTKTLASFTVLAQIADRGGALAGFLLSFSIVGLTGLGGEQELNAGILVGVSLNFIFSGLAVAVLALWFLMRRWGFERHRAMPIAVRTAVITNPAWVMIAWFISSQ